MKRFLTIVKEHNTYLNYLWLNKNTTTNNVRKTKYYIMNINDSIYESMFNEVKTINKIKSIRAIIFI